MMYFLYIPLFVLFVSASALAKAFMDASKFRRVAGKDNPVAAFAWASPKFQDFMFREGKMPVLKLDDGWHLFQTVMFFFFGAALFLCGSLFEWYWYVPCLLARSAVHGAVFEFIYKKL